MAVVKLRSQCCVAQAFACGRSAVNLLDSIETSMSMLINSIRWYVGIVVWTFGVPFVLGIPLRNIGNLLSNTVLRKPAPGPLLAKATRLWKVGKISNGHFHDNLIVAHQTHGRLSQ